MLVMMVKMLVWMVKGSFEATTPFEGILDSAFVLLFKKPTLLRKTSVLVRLRLRFFGKAANHFS